MTMIKRWVVACVGAVLVAMVVAPTDAKADVGSCYSVRPICLSGAPACMCDYSMNCYWVCR